MQDLRLIGVHEGGDHLLLADAEGVRYRLPLDEPLRAAARRDRPRLGQLQIEIEGGLRPRDVQSLIRAGLSTEEVADRSGWSVEKVRRFEGPVLAEREFMAIRAQRAVLSHDGRVTLGDRAGSRLRARGVDVDDVVWDSLREESGHWLVSATFAAGGRERTATWRFEPQTQQLRAQNDDARWLGEDEKAGPIPAPHVARTGVDEVFDVTRPSRPTRPAVPTVTPTVSSTARAQDDELTESLRAHSTQRGRRGRRRPTSPSHAPGEHLSPVDALPLEPLLGEDLEVLGPPPDRPRPESAKDATPHSTPGAAANVTLESQAEVEVETASSSPSSSTESAPAPGHGEDDAVHESSSDLRGGEPAEPEQEPQLSESESEPESELEAAQSEPEPAESTPTESKPTEPKPTEAKPAETGRRGRARVPSWDDVVFGTRSRPSSPDR